MANVDRVTVTLPNELLRDIDRREKNRSKFVAEAVRNELDPPVHLLINWPARLNAQE